MKEQTLSAKKRIYSSREGWTSIVVNTFIAALKYWAGMVSGSAALIADAWHSLTDSISSVIVIVGGRISTKPADDKHPYGHGRLEIITTFLVSLLLFIVAFSFAKESLSKFINHQEAKFGLLAIIVLIVSIIAKELLAQYAFYCARKADSLALKADGWHHRSDAISSIIILIGILFGKNLWWMDSLLTMIVALIFGYSAYKVTMETLSKFLGEVPEKKIIERIKDISNETAATQTYAHHFHLHDYVTHKELTFHLKLDPKSNINDAHNIVSLIEKKIAEELDIEATIHIEPHKNKDK